MISHKISRYDTIRSESVPLYVRTACCQLQTTAIYGRTYSSKQTTGHNTGAPSFCLSTLSPQQVPGYWLTGITTVGGWPVSLKSRSFSWATVSTGCQTIAAVETAIVWPPHSMSVWRPHARRAVARLKYLVIAQSLNI